MRVFNAEKAHKGIDFLEDLKESINEILQHTKSHEIIDKEISVSSMQNFPVNIHYIFEDEENLLVTAIFKI